MSLSGRRGDDADVIRARLRRLLADAEDVAGWVPDDEPAADDHDDEPRARLPQHPPGPAEDAGPPAGRSAGARQGSSALPDGIGRHRSPGAGVRWSPGRAGARAVWLAGVAAALALTTWTWLDRPQVEPAPEPVPVSSSESPAAAPPVPAGRTTEAPASVVVSVVGLVARPGLVTLPAGARVADAVEAAGGLLPEADPASVNQAAVVTDGQQIAVGVPGAPPAAGGGPPDSGPAGSGGPVDLNTATVAELDALPGIGPVLAQRIVDHRTEVGPFGSVEDLDDVPGIGPTTAADLADLVTV